MAGRLAGSICARVGRVSCACELQCTALLGVCVVARWLQGQAWNLELGWVSPFETGDRGVWGEWLLSQGIYTKLELRF